MSSNFFNQGFGGDALLVVVVAEWLIGVIILVMNRKKDYARWISYTAFAAGLGGFSVIVGETVRPYFWNLLQSQQLDNLLALCTHVFSFIAQNVAPYTYILFCICYSGFFSKRSKRILRVVLVFPVIMMLIVSPIHPVFDLSHVLMTTWVAPYVLIGDFLLVYALIKEKDPLLKRSLFFTNALMIPPTLFSLVTNYFLRSFGIEDTWRLNPWAIALQIALFATFMIKYEVLGVKVTFEERLNSTLRAMASGTGILNHAIKNEVLLISVCAENLKKPEIETDPGAKEDVGTIANAAQHLLNMVARIQEKMQDIVLDESHISADVLVTESQALIGPFLEAKQIVVIKEGDFDVKLVCDPTHMKEVISNIMKNAMEAMQPGGLIRICVNKTKKKFTIAIVDNGSGISKENLRHVFDPFFSTKKNRNLNFGLGLSYGYSVMQKHSGSLEIQSEEQVGTMVSLHLPARRVVRFAVQSGWEVSDGTQFSHTRAPGG